MQNARRDKGPGSGPVGVAAGLRAPAPVRRVGLGPEISHAQNSLAGVDGFQLSAQEMRSLNQLEDRLASGRLGRADGWTADDVTGPDWDPTTYVD